MAIPGGYRFKVPFDDVFPERAYTLGIEPVYEFDDKKKGGPRRQARDEATGHPIWAVLTIDPAGRGKGTAVKVKVPHPFQPEPPQPVPGSPFAEVEFEGLTATPYIEGRATGLGSPTASERRR